MEIEKDWTTKAGLRAICAVMIHRGKRWHRCGYVEIPKGHRLHGVDYHTPLLDIPKEAAENAHIGKKSPILAFTAGCDALEGETVRRSLDVVMDVHGGLTYGGEGYPAEGWWFGFDCGHCDDGKIDPDPMWPNHDWTVVRSQDYVESECESLAAQIVAMFPLQSCSSATSQQGEK